MARMFSNFTRVCSATRLPRRSGRRGRSLRSNTATRTRCGRCCASSAVCRPRTTHRSTSCRRRCSLHSPPGRPRNRVSNVSFCAKHLLRSEFARSARDLDLEVSTTNRARYSVIRTDVKYLDMALWQISSMWEVTKSEDSMLWANIRVRSWMFVVAFLSFSSTFLGIRWILTSSLLVSLPAPHASYLSREFQYNFLVIAATLPYFLQTRTRMRWRSWRRRLDNWRRKLSETSPNRTKEFCS